MRATRVGVTDSMGSGFKAGIGGHMVLMDCSAESCSGAGAQVLDKGSKGHVEGCTFKQNGGGGVVATDHAEVTVKGSRSQHSIAGDLSLIHI